MKKMEQLYEGKAKKVYATDDPNYCIVDYKADATAFTGEGPVTVPTPPVRVVEAVGAGAGASSFQMIVVSAKAMPAAISSSMRYTGMLFTAGMPRMPVMLATALFTRPLFARFFRESKENRRWSLVMY